MSEIIELKLELNRERQRLLQTQIMLLQMEYAELQRLKDEVNHEVLPSNQE